VNGSRVFHAFGGKAEGHLAQGLFFQILFLDAHGNLLFPDVSGQGAWAPVLNIRKKRLPLPMKPLSELSAENLPSDLIDLSKYYQTASLVPHRVIRGERRIPRQRNRIREHIDIFVSGLFPACKKV